MGFIDEADLSRAVCYLFIYGINLKSRKWWHSIVWCLVDVAVVKNNILYELSNKQPQLTLKHFTCEVVNGLIGADTSLGCGRRLTDSQNSSIHMCLRAKELIGHQTCLWRQATWKQCTHCSTKKNPPQKSGFLRHARFSYARGKNETVLNSSTSDILKTCNVSSNRLI
jgi:hypothetical protein